VAGEPALQRPSKQTPPTSAGVGLSQPASKFEISTDATIGEGRHELRFEFEPTAPPDIAHGKGTPARGQLYVDGKLAAQGDLPVTIPLNIGIVAGLSVGRDAVGRGS
jgi:hypothetical protein